MQNFYDDASGLFFYTASNAEVLIARKFELQDNVAYWKNFLEDKIIWGELSDRPKFTLDTEGYYHCLFKTK